MYSVVITTYKRPDYLKLLLKSMEAPEIIVVNMGPKTEEIDQICSQYGARQIHIEEDPVARGINIGIISAKYDHVICCNDDIELHSKQEFDKLYAVYLRNDIGILSPKIMEQSDSDEINNQYEQEYFHPSLANDRANELLGRVFACFMISKKVFFDIGLIDETFFFYYDDIDYLRRTHFKGYKFGFWNGAVISHFAAREFRPSPPEDLNEYYKLKWGGYCGREQYTFPFNLNTNQWRK